jgi:hypothetical protein
MIAEHKNNDQIRRLLLRCGAQVNSKLQRSPGRILSLEEEPEDEEGVSLQFP